MRASERVKRFLVTGNLAIRNAEVLGMRGSASVSLIRSTVRRCSLLTLSGASHNFTSYRQISMNRADNLMVLRRKGISAPLVHARHAVARQPGLDIGELSKGIGEAFRVVWLDLLVLGPTARTLRRVRPP